MRKFLIAAALLIAGGVSAQTASYTYIDQKAPYKNLDGILKAKNTPRLGRSLHLEVPCSSYSTAHMCYIHPSFVWNGVFLMTGASNPDLDLGPIGFAQARLLTSAETIQLLPNTSIRPPCVTKVLFPIPNDRSLLGLSFYQQLMFISMQSLNQPCPFSIHLSRGGHGIIGT